MERQKDRNVTETGLAYWNILEEICFRSLLLDGETEKKIDKMIERQKDIKDRKNKTTM